MTVARAPLSVSGRPARCRAEFGLAAALAACLSLGGCGSDEEPDLVQLVAPVPAPGAYVDPASRPLVAPYVDPYTQAVVIGPSPNFDLANLPAHWYAATATSGNVPKITLVQQQGALSLRLVADSQGAIVGRKVNIPLLNMPYLRWGWLLEPQAAAPAPTAANSEPEVWLRVVVGFQTSLDQHPGTIAQGPPQIDRTMSLEWRANAEHPPAAQGSVAMRAGAAEAGKWIFEAVDMSRIYSAAWPEDNIAAARIVFVAVGAGPTAIPGAGYIAEVVLVP